MRALPLLVFIGLALPEGVASAQTARSVPSAPAVETRRITEGDDAHLRLRPGEALEIFESILTERPDAYGALWRAARESVNLGMLSSSPEDRARWYEKSEVFARHAREADPNGAEGAEWLAITLGRKALDNGPRTRVALAVQTREAALTALALDSLNAGAHHVLGAWHAEVCRLSGVERWLARKLFGGGILAEARWDEAEAHLRRAVELDPADLIHRLDLARVYLDLDRMDDARNQLREILERPAVEPVDPLHKQTAQELLREILDAGAGADPTQDSGAGPPTTSPSGLGDLR